MFGRTLRRMRRRWRRIVAITVTVTALSGGGLTAASATATGADSRGFGELVGILTNLLTPLLLW